MSERSKRMLVSCAVCGLILAVLSLLTVRIPQGDDFQTPNAGATVPIGPIYDGLKVTQQVIATGRLINSISVQLATYKRANAGKLTLEVARYAKRWRPLAKKTMRKRRLRDNEFQAFVFEPPLRVKAGQLLAITVSADSDPSQGIAWWANPSFEEKGLLLLVNGEKQPGTANFSIAYAPAEGRLVTVLPEFGKRMGVFLNGYWRAVAVVACLVALFCVVHLSLWTSEPRGMGVR